MYDSHPNFMHPLIYIHDDDQYQLIQVRCLKPNWNWWCTVKYIRTIISMHVHCCERSSMIDGIVLHSFSIFFIIIFFFFNSPEHIEVESGETHISHYKETRPKKEKKLGKSVDRHYHIWKALISTHIWNRKINSCRTSIGATIYKCGMWLNVVLWYINVYNRTYSLLFSFHRNR